VAFLLAVIAPLLIVLSAIVGVGIGWLLVSLVRTPSMEVQRQRERELAKQSARRAVEETLHGLHSG
jgi:peptidoglycan/LPS O-acetylase OafA/YrhL